MSREHQPPSGFFRSVHLKTEEMGKERYVKSLDLGLEFSDRAFAQTFGTRNAHRMPHPAKERDRENLKLEKKKKQKQESFFSKSQVIGPS